MPEEQQTQEAQPNPGGTATDTQQQAPGGQEQEPQQPASKTYSEEYVKELRAEAAKYRTAQKAAMTDAERAVAEAEERGRTTAVQAYGKRLATSEFNALAAKRNPDFDTSGVLGYLDLTRFVGDDGEPNVKELKSAIDRLVPAPKDGPPNLDGGTRTPPNQPVTMSDLIRKQLGQ